MEKNNQYHYNIILKHLLDILSGECSISDKEIRNTELTEVQEILTGLLYVHEDLKYHTTKAKDASLDFERFLHHSNDNVCVIDTTGNFHKINDTFCSTTGITQDERITKNFWTLIHEHDRSRARTEFDQLSKCEETTKIDFRMRNPKNEIVFLSWKFTPDEKTNTFLAIGRDVTKEHNQLKRLKKSAKRLERKNQELMKFNYAIAHDMRTPLRGIASLASFIEEEIDDEQPELAKGNLRLIKDRVKRLVNIMDGLADFIMVDKIESDFTKFSLNELIKDILRKVAPDKRMNIVLPEKDHHLKTDRKNTCRYTGQSHFKCRYLS